jgi:hypothetical protein
VRYIKGMVQLSNRDSIETHRWMLAAIFTGIMIILIGHIFLGLTVFITLRFVGPLYEYYMDKFIEALPNWKDCKKQLHSYFIEDILKETAQYREQTLKKAIKRII